MTRFLIASLLALSLNAGIAAQPATKSTAAKVTKAAVPANDIFSGTVTGLPNGSITVLRKVPGRADETRTFVVDKDTKTEGQLKVHSRVTVRFQADSEGDAHALRVVVRADAKAGTGAGKAQSRNRAK